MKYYQHGETGRVVATEAELIGEWYEIEKDQYEDALHPLSRPTQDAPDLATPSEPGADSISKNIAWRDGFTNPPSG